MRPIDIACIVLASGQSKRFGVADKLEAKLDGKTVLEMVIDTVNSVGFGQVYIVSQYELQGHFKWIENIDPEKGQGHSLRLGLRTAIENKWDNVVIALGDMPLVKSVNFVNMISEIHKKQMVVSDCEGVRMPPACFGRKVMDQILEDKSAKGARHFFDKIQPTTVKIDAESCQDVDTPEDLIRVRDILKRSKL